MRSRKEFPFPPKSTVTGAVQLASTRLQHHITAFPAGDSGGTKGKAVGGNASRPCTLADCHRPGCLGFRMDYAITDIKVEPAKRRPLNLEKVAELAESVGRIGLLNPVTVLDGGRLIAGYHRLEACRRLGWTTVPVMVAPLSAPEAELAEIDENLVRNDLTVLERGEHLARRKVLYEEAHPEAKAGAARAAGMNRSLGNNVGEIISPTFAQDTASRIGVSSRTIQQEVQIADSISPAVKDAIRAHDLADSKTELLKLSRLEPATQAEVATKITSGAADRVDQALEQIIEAEIISEVEGKFYPSEDPPAEREARPLQPTTEQRRLVTAYRESRGENVDGATLASGMFSSIRRLAEAPLTARDFKEELLHTAPAMLSAARACCPAVRSLIDEIERDEL